MKPAPFSYFRPSSLDEALELLATHADLDAKPLAGGQSLIPMMNFRVAQPGVLVDLGGVPGLAGIALADGRLRIGAMTRHNDVAGAPEIAAHAPMVALAYRHVAHFTVRNRGTLGGNLCHADPASEMPMVMRVLEAGLVIAGPAGQRAVAAEDFFFGTFTTAVEPDELLIGIELPLDPPGRRVAFHEVSLRKGDFAMSAVGAAFDPAPDGSVAGLRIGLCGVSDIPLRAPEAEALLLGGRLDDSQIRRAADCITDQLEFAETASVSAAYRRDLTHALVRRTLADCAKEQP